MAKDEDGDTLYAVDRVSEEVIVDYFSELSLEKPVILIAEGLENGGRTVIPDGASEEDAAFRILMDPIDGTRGLMYQKRSAWILTGVAPNRGPSTTLADVELAVQTEIPLLKQHLSDTLWAVAGEGAHAERRNRLTGESRPISLGPSRARSIEHGFAMISRFFPGGAGRARGHRRGDRPRGARPAARGKGPVLRGSVHLERRAALRASVRARPFRRRSEAVAFTRRRGPRLPSRHLRSSLRPLDGAHRARARGPRHRRARTEAVVPPRPGVERHLGRICQRSHSRADPAPFAGGSDSAGTSLIERSAPGRLDVMGGIADYSGLAGSRAPPQGGDPGVDRAGGVENPELRERAARGWALDASRCLSRSSLGATKRRGRTFDGIPRGPGSPTSREPSWS